MIKKLVDFIKSKSRQQKGEFSEQCADISCSSREFNVCIKKSGHRGLHMSADGQSWF